MVREERWGSAQMKGPEWVDDDALLHKSLVRENGFSGPCGNWLGNIEVGGDVSQEPDHAREDKTVGLRAVLAAAERVICGLLTW